jgi:hypothetical protein
VRSPATVISALVLAAALSGIAGIAEAHKRSVRRALFLETANTRDLHVIAAIRIPSGDARVAFNLLADTDRDGKYSDKERARVRSMLAGRALDGIRIFTGTTAVSLGAIEAKEKIEPGDGVVEVMIHAKTSIPEKVGAELSVTTTSIGDPLDLMVLPGSRPVESSSRGRIEGGGFKAELGQSDRVSFRIR